MPTRSSKDHRFPCTAVRFGEQAIGEDLDGAPLEKSRKNPAAVALGKLGGAPPKETIRDREESGTGAMGEIIARLSFGYPLSNSRPGTWDIRLKLFSQ
ncbi:MAG TPA: hypothetical protein VHZ74_16475 [Bryobacteraceae bacterium]|jgi:hypothetical protein|nr:hypothetical protein [Bryobacteraceae bacterium]